MNKCPNCGTARQDKPIPNNYGISPIAEKRGIQKYKSNSYFIYKICRILPIALLGLFSMLIIALLAAPLQRKIYLELPSAAAMII